MEESCLSCIEAVGFGWVGFGEPSVFGIEVALCMPAPLFLFWCRGRMRECFAVDLGKEKFKVVLDILIFGGTIARANKK